ncbi:MAG: hypothetical protein CTY18_02920 [Methylomonas sp.]|nr:MAG: hypothetical protein CTY18_02920 [Methylomonas sp.]
MLLDNIAQLPAASQYGKGMAAVNGMPISSDGTKWLPPLGCVAVEQFGPCGFSVAGTPNDDASVFQAAFDATGNPASIWYRYAVFLDPSKIYYLITHVTIGGQFFGVKSLGAIIRPHPSNPHPYISSPTTPDLSYPTASAAGPLRGCAFYFTSLIYYAEMQGVELRNFRFGLAYLGPHNTPRFTRVSWFDCNAGVICYSSAQNYTFYGCETDGAAMGVLMISSATATPSGHPNFGLDSSFTDGTRFVGDGASIGGGAINDNFDNWFIDSILRPTVPSSNAGFSNYVYPHVATDRECRPSGWGLHFLPMRTPRTVFGYYAQNMDYRTRCQRGIALINSDIRQLVIDTMWGEEILASASEYFRIGRTHDGVVSGYQVQNGALDKPFFTLTGKGNAGRGDLQGITFVGVTTSQTPGVDSQFYPGLTSGVLAASSTILESIRNPYSLADERPGGSLAMTLSTTRGIRRGSQGEHEESFNTILELPYFWANSSDWKVFARLDADNTDLYGIMSISMINARTGESDMCDYVLQTRPRSVIIGNGVTIRNGDAEIVYTGADPAQCAPHSQWQIGNTGVLVSARSVDSAANKILLAAPISGLAANYVGDGSTTTVSKAAFCRMFTGLIKTGTISCAGGTTAVSGVSTRFNRDIQEGDYLYNAATGSYVGQVSTIQSDTALTLTGNGPVISGVSICRRASNWVAFGFGLAPYYNSATDLYLVNRVCGNNGTSGTPTLGATSVSLILNCKYRSFV